MNIALTGASGFIGSHLLTQLEKSHSVLNLSRTILDSLSDPELKVCLRENKIHAIIHLATHYSQSTSDEEAEKMIAANILLGLRLLRAIEETPEVWFFNTGSALENGGRDNETPVNFYAATKKAFSLYLPTFPNPFVTLKIYESYGASDRRNKILQRMDDSIRSGKSLALSPGEQILDFCHVSDIAHAYLHVLELIQSGKGEQLRGKEFALSGERISLRGLAELYSSVTGKKLILQWGALPYRENEIMLPAVLPALPGWRSTISLKDGLRLLFAES